MKQLRLNETELLKLFNELVETINNVNDCSDNEQEIEFYKHNPAELLCIDRDSFEYDAINNILQDCFYTKDINYIDIINARIQKHYVTSLIHDTLHVYYEDKNRHMCSYLCTIIFDKKFKMMDCLDTNMPDLCNVQKIIDELNNKYNLK